MPCTKRRFSTSSVNKGCPPFWKMERRSARSRTPIVSPWDPERRRCRRKSPQIGESAIERFSPHPRGYRRFRAGLGPHSAVEVLNTLTRRHRGWHGPGRAQPWRPHRSLRARTCGRSRQRSGHRTRLLQAAPERHDTTIGTLQPDEDFRAVGRALDTWPERSSAWVRGCRHGSIAIDLISRWAPLSPGAR